MKIMMLTFAFLISCTFPGSIELSFLIALWIKSEIISLDTILKITLNAQRKETTMIN